MKINDIFKDEYIGKKVKDSEGEIWVVDKCTLTNSIGTEIQDYYTLTHLLKEDFNILEEKKTGWEKKSKKGIAYYINANNEILSYYINDDSFEKILFENYNYFITKEKAEEVADFQFELRKTLKYLDTEVEEEYSKRMKKGLKQILIDISTENAKDKYII